VSALVDGARVDMEAVGTEGGRAARQETSVAVATGGADCHVRCHCRHCQVCQGDASDGTGMPFRTLGKNPCARVAMDASACEKKGWVKIWSCGVGVGGGRKGSIQGR
jgi:hypothetical protein